jgi:uncharacterized protein
MSEITMMIPVEDFHLEARYEVGHGMEAAILCHPHPLYGGDMDNNVVLALRSAMRKMGWGTLRFNFRGVGSSGGAYGEGEGEAGDLMAVASHLLEQGCTVACVAGYSFGAWVVLKAVRKGLDARSLVLISPPLDLLRFGDLNLPSRPCLVTLGGKDEFCSVDSLSRWVASHPSAVPHAKVELLVGCDHFYWSHEEELVVKTIHFLDSHFGLPQPSHASA